MVYVGHMESFNFGEEDTKQCGGMELSIEFMANRVFDLATPPANVLPMEGPQTRNRGQGTALRGGGAGVSFFTMPGVGGTSSVADSVNRAWERTTGYQAGSQIGAFEGQHGVLTSRRR
jgi:hypothetical protein